MKLTKIEDPFRPSINPSYHEIDKADSIRNILIDKGMIESCGARKESFVVAVNGDYKLEKDWDLVLTDKDFLVVYAVPPNLRGGGGGSNPLRIVLMVAVMVASIYIPPLAGLGAFGTGLLQAGILVGGSLLVNGLLPAPKMGAGGFNDSGQPKQVNFIGNQANQVRPGSPVANLYGRRRVYPDLIMQPYYEMSGNEVYMHSLYVVTQGKIDLEKIFIEKTPIDNFAEVEYKLIKPNEKMDLFPDNVYTAPEVSELRLEGGSGGISQVVGYVENVSYSTEGKKIFKNTTYSPLSKPINFQGGFISTPLTAESEIIGIDVMLPRGLAYMKDDGGISSLTVRFIVQAREVDESNNPVGDWFNLTKGSSGIPSNKKEQVSSEGRPYSVESINAGISITAGTIDPILESYYFNVTKSRYEIRVGRIGDEQGSSRAMDELKWNGLRSYMANKLYYGNVTLLAVKIRATNNLNSGISSRVNLIGTRILPVLENGTWVEKPTRSIAWATADILRNKEYGRGIKDSRINLKELERLDRIWFRRGDFFDGYFTEQITIWDAISRVLEVGRTKPVYVAGVIDFVRNEPKVAPSQMFTPENIVRDTFTTRSIFQKTGEADHVIVEYTDPVSWLPTDMICALPGSKMEKAIRLAMHGITSPQQAWREGIHRAAMHADQREFYTWSTELEGLAVSYGNEVLVSYDSTDWGSNGRIVFFEKDVIYTSNTLDFTGNDLIILRAKNGSIMGTYRIEKISDKSGRVFGLPLNQNGEPDLSDGSFMEPTHYIFGNNQRLGKRLIVTKIQPNNDNSVDLEAVVYSQFAHNAENELEMPVVVPPHDPIEEVLAITWIKVNETIQRDVYSVSCNQARGARSYEFEVSEVIGAEFKPLQNNETPLYTGSLPFGSDVRIRVRAIGTYSGEWFYWDGEVKESISPIELLKPDMIVTQSGEFVVNFNITITAVDSDESLNYYILQDDLVIWSGILLSKQTATLRRQIVKDTELEEDMQTVKFNAYGVDSQNIRTLENSIEVIY